MTKHPLSPISLSTPIIMASLVFLTGLLLTAWGFHVLHDFNREQLRTAIKAQYESQAEQVQEKLNVGLDSLYSIAALRLASQEMTRDVFSTFVQHDAAYHTGTLALGWAPRLKQDQLAQFIQENRQHSPRFSIYEVSGHGSPFRPRKGEIIYPMQYLIALNSDQLREGLNLLSIPSARKSMNSALSTHAISVSRRVRLYSGQGEFGFQAFLPVFGSNSTSDMLGFATGLFDITALIETIFSDEIDLTITLLDKHAQNTEQFLYSNYQASAKQGLDHLPPLRTLEHVEKLETAHWTREIVVADRTWLAVFQARSPSLASNNFLPFLGVASGLLITSLITLYLFLAQLRGRQLFISQQDVERERQKKQLARQESREKSRFLHAASHDLRQPLASLSLYAELIARKQSLPADTQNLLDKMQVSVGSLNDMFNDLLQFGQLESGKLQIHIHPFRLQTLLDKIQTDFYPVAKEKGLDLLIEEGNYSLNSDPALVERILRNYISNAIRYTEKGSIKIYSERVETDLDILRINVKDTGPGLSVDQQNQIFNEFYRLDQIQNNQESDQQPGLGLGLSIVAFASNLLNSNYGVNSKPEEGATFYIDIPLA